MEWISLSKTLMIIFCFLLTRILALLWHLIQAGCCSKHDVVPYFTNKGIVKLLNCWSFWYEYDGTSKICFAGSLWLRILDNTMFQSSSYLTQVVLASCQGESEVGQACLTICDPIDCRLPASSIHRIFQARILEWVAISFSRGSSRPRDHTGSSALQADFSAIWATRKSPLSKACALRTKWGVNTVKGGYLMYYLWR